MADYRKDAAARCSRCQQLAEREDLILTSDGAPICPACRVVAAADGHTAAVIRAGSVRWCPACAAPIVRCDRGRLIWTIECSGCKRSTSLITTATFLIAWIALLATPFFAVHTPILMIAALGLFGLMCARDIVMRTRFHAATPEEVASHERNIARQAAEIGAAAGPRDESANVRVVVPDGSSEAVDEAAAAEDEEAREGRSRAR